jgi:cobalamin biosynthesis Mg chelatase CobN
MYPDGTYDATKAGTCSGAPEQFVYENPCPKPKPSSSSSPEGSASGSGDASGDASQPSASGSGTDDAKSEQVSADQAAATSITKSEGAAPSSGFSVGVLLLVSIAAFFY